MRASDILSKGIREIKHEDKTYSYSGKADFKPDAPEIKVFGPKGPIQRPRTRASQNNSYT